MPDEEESKDQLKSQAIDYVSSGVKGILGAAPFAGSLLAEIAGTIIPRQRIDRIADFAVRLENRIHHLENKDLSEYLNDEDFTELVEEALRQAARSTTEARREYLASLVANSLTSEMIQHAESKHILRMLGELNDVEVLWLRFFYRSTPEDDARFQSLHEEVLTTKIACISCTLDQLNAHALQESYKEHLSQLGLLTRQISKDSDGKSEFDSFSGDLKVRYYFTSSLGELLLERIGMIMRTPRKID
jgi:hypothetical protein